MISPSKVKHQQHKQPSRDISDIHSHVRLQRGRKPLEKKSFYLDIKNHRLLASLEEKIKVLGGVIELFLVKSVTLVVSDRADKFGQNSCDKKKWGYGSGESGGPPSLRSIEVRTPISTPPTPYGGEYPLSNSTNIRSQTAHRSKSRADAMLERALTQPQQCSVDPLNNAQNWGIPIWAPKRLQGWLEKIYESLKDSSNLKRDVDQSNTEKSLKVKHLKNSYIKFESFKRDTRPVFLELPVWPKLNFDGDSGTCPFDTRLREQKVCKEETGTLNKQKGKEMTRRPRAATATRGRRTEQLVAGYCEICRIDYRDLSKHLQSDKHLAFVRNDDNFLSLDNLINSGASVEAFLRANEVGQDCNIFPDGDKTLHSVDIDDEKVKSNAKTDLSNFSVEDIKMVQCNGARRNINLKLSSPHNLRTRSKKESGHLLRSKGSPWHEVSDKNDKFYDKLEGFTIKKRAKGTIWIEEDENPVKKCSRIEEIKEIDGVNEKLNKASITGDNNFSCQSKEFRDHSTNKKCESFEERVLPKLERNDLAIGSDVENDSSRIVNIPRLEKETRSNEEIGGRNGIPKAEDVRRVNERIADECKNGFNGFEPAKAPESFPASQLPGNSTTNDIAATTTLNHKSPLRENTKVEGGSRELEIVCNGVVDKSDKMGQKISKESKEEKPKGSRIGKRSGRGFRGRPRLSVEERLIEDNRAYYKVEVLGNKLRSSTGPWSASTTTNNGALKNATVNEDETALNATTGTGKMVTNENPEVARPNDEPSSEKPVVVRFKRVRRSELSLLSDEAESFMFGEPKRDDESSEVSDADQSSVMPRDTESSDWDSSNVNATRNSTLPSSPVNSSSSVKQEIIEDDSQDSMYAGRARKRRRTQAEALIKDNEDYYKFETPGSRLRFQTPLMGLKEHTENLENSCQLKEPQEIKGENANEDSVPVEKLYPSKPSPEIEKMQFSFEAVPRSEPWYQTYQRQDEGAEFWHYFSEADERKPFLLPYEIENFHERLAKLCQKSDTRRKNRGRGRNGMGRSPRKSPRCHASTLAIMSTIIRKREQQQQPVTNLSVVEEESSPRCSSTNRNDTPKPEQNKQQQQSQEQQARDQEKSDTDLELREIAKSIDAMLSAETIPDPEDSFEAVLLQQQAHEKSLEGPTLQPGPPADLLDLLDNCHEYFNCLENSSCASSECGEMGNNTESPLKRRKKRKNRTGWPGIKMRKKMQAKQLIDAYVARERLLAKKMNEGKRTILSAASEDTNDVLQRLKATGDSTTGTTTEKCDEKAKNNEDTETEKVENNSETSSKRENTTRNTEKSFASEITVVEGVEQGTRRKSKENSGVALPPLQCETVSGSEESSLLHNEESLGRKSASLKMNETISLANDENHCRSDVNNSVTTRQLGTKIATRKRQRVHDTSSEMIDSRLEIENNDNLYINNVNSTIISRKNYNTTNGISKRRPPKDSTTAVTTEAHDAEHIIDHHDVTTCQKDSLLPRKVIRTRKRQRRGGSLRNELDYEDENCKNDTYTSSIKPTSKTDNVRSVKGRNNEAVTSETLDSDIECPLGERVSPSLLPTTELQSRRSSIEFQPVVRMMKIEDQVEMDHSILSVTVASNRRLRSSSSPRSNVQPAAKRYKKSKGPFGRWIKNS
ncbi:uncharacterized protein chif [Venturia canescens]|uniref:uncharacterized protein chif n=1 Tax=Venturia canescens TaxID=32260 RepID=UPI001C9C3CB7|nr:uncharacterized protein LOC122406699 [Venturia canescens]